MKIGIDIDGVILDYERVLKTYGDLYDFIELKKDGIINRNEHYLRNRYNWTEEERMNFINKYFLKLSRQTNLIPGAKDVINMLKNEGHELIVISARGGMIIFLTSIILSKNLDTSLYSATNTSVFLFIKTHFITSLSHLINIIGNKMIN